MDGVLKTHKMHCPQAQAFLISLFQDDGANSPLLYFTVNNVVAMTSIPMNCSNLITNIQIDGEVYALVRLREAWMIL